MPECLGASAPAVVAASPGVLIALTAICVLFGAAMVAVGRLAARLRRDPGRSGGWATEDEERQRRMLRLNSISCYIAAGLLFVVAASLIADIHLLEQ